MSIYHYVSKRVNDPNMPGVQTYILERCINWRYIGYLALYGIGWAALAAELYLLSGLLPQIFGGAS